MDEKVLNLLSVKIVEKHNQEYEMIGTNNSVTTNYRYLGTNTYWDH